MIFVFKDDVSFRSYKLQRNGRPANYAGVFVDTPEGTYVGMNGDKEEDPYAIIYHEYVHDELTRRYGSIPLWLNEGFAEYYSTFVMHDERAELGRALPHHVRLLREKPIMRFDEFFGIDANSRAYHEGERQSMFYAQSWALVHYCLHAEPGMPAKLQAFLEAIATDVPVATAFEESFQADYDAIELELVQYARRDEFSYRRIQLEGLKIDETTTVVPLPRSDLLILLGNYITAATPWRLTDATAHFRAAVQLAPQDARAHAGMGANLAKEKRWSEAREHFQQAIELNRDDASVFLRYGLAQLEEASGDSIPVRPTALPPGVEAARALLSRCLEIDANHGEAYLGIGRSYLFDPDDVGPGLAALAQARELLPARPDVDYATILLLLRKGDEETAKQLADHLIEYARDPEIVEHVKMAFDYHATGTEVDRYNAILDSMNRGDVVTGIARLEILLATARDEQVRAAATATLGEARRNLAQQDSVQLVNKQIDEYNRAVNFANAGQRDAAVRVLDELLRVTQDPNVTEKARDLRRQLSSGSSVKRKP